MHMLPRLDGLGIAHGNTFSFIQSPHAIRNDPVFGPVSSTDHEEVAGGGSLHGKDQESKG